MVGFKHPSVEAHLNRRSKRVLDLQHSVEVATENDLVQLLDSLGLLSTTLAKIQQSLFEHFHSAFQKISFIPAFSRVKNNFWTAGITVAK